MSSSINNLKSIFHTDLWHVLVCPLNGIPKDIKREEIEDILNDKYSTNLKPMLQKLNNTIKVLNETYT